MVKPLEKIFILLVILSSGALISVDYSFIKILMVAVFTILIVSRQVILRVKSNLFMLIAIVVAIWLFQSILYGDSNLFSDTVKTSVIFIIMMIYPNTNPERNMERVLVFYKILMFFCVLSGVLFLMILLNVNLPTVVSVIERDTIYYLQTYTGGNILDSLWYRNSGIFWEPGLYQCFLNFMLIYVLFIMKGKKKKRILHIMIIMISIVSTGSLLGYFISFAILITYFFINSKKKEYKILFVCMALIFMAILSPKLLLLLKNKMTTASYEIRVNDLLSGIKLYLTRPIFGHGVCNNAYENMQQIVYGVSRGNSNGFINALISFGTVGMAGYLYLFYRFCVLMHDRTSSKVTIPLLMWFLASLISEPISPMPFVFMFIGMGYSYLRSTKLIEFRNKVYSSSLMKTHL